jgi:hypothetical protein
MTDQPTPPANDARAQAAAAKAYAKAQRPWYKKKRWIISIAVVVLIVIGAAAGGSGSDDKGTQATDSPTAPATNSQTEEPTADPPSTKKAAVADNSSKGKGAITWGNWEVVGKIQVTKDALDQFDVVTRVRNTGDDSDEGLFTVTILKGDEILGTADCSTSTVQPGAIGTADCISLDNFKPGWTEVTIEDSY